MTLDLLTAEQLAKELGVKTTTLAKWRTSARKKPLSEKNLPFLKIGIRIFYRKKDVNDWLEKHLVF